MHNDVLTGGIGLDRFLYRAGDGLDTITDFGIDDEIVLEGFGEEQVSLSQDDGVTTIAAGNVTITLEDQSAFDVESYSVSEDAAGVHITVGAPLA